MIITKGIIETKPIYKETKLGASIDPDTILYSKEYKYFKDPNKINIIHLEHSSKYILIRVIFKENMNLFFYGTKLNLQSLISFLDLPKNKYRSLNEITNLLNFVFSNGKISIIVNEKKYVKLVIFLLNKNRDKKGHILILDYEDENFKKSPNLRYKKTIIDTNNVCNGMNDIFEVYKSAIDFNNYLVVKNVDNFNLNIINLRDDKIVNSLKGHNNEITTVRYFYNNNEGIEYLISADINKIVIIWNMNNFYKKLYTIDTKYNGFIFSCLLLFNINNYNFIITSTNSASYNKDNSSTKVFSLENGMFIKILYNTNINETYYLLYWFNKRNHEHYIIELCADKISINNLLKENSYADLAKEPDQDYYGAIIFTRDYNDYLCSCTSRGVIRIWDLYKKNLRKSIKVSPGILQHIIQWSNKYAIIADFDNKLFRIIDLDNGKIISSIGGQHKNGIMCIKKFVHPIYGPSLLTADYDGKIILWTV